MLLSNHACKYDQAFNQGHAYNQSGRIAVLYMQDRPIPNQKIWAHHERLKSRLHTASAAYDGQPGQQSSELSEGKY